MNYRKFIIHSNMVIQLLFLIYLTVRIIKLIRDKKINWHLEIIRLLFIIYIAELVNVTLFPVFIDIGNKLSIFPISYEKRVYSVFVNINPFYYNFNHASLHTVIKNILGNIFLMIPYTILLPFNFRKMRKWYTAIGTAFLTSVSIELIQLVWQLTMLSTARKTDINDIIQNLIGAVIGFVCYNFLFRKVPILQPFIINNDNIQENR